MLGSHNTRHLPNGIHIKSASTTLAESSLHGGLVGGVRSGVVEPIGVQGSGSVRENEGISRRGVRCIQDSDLRSDLRVSVVMDEFRYSFRKHPEDSRDNTSGERSARRNDMEVDTDDCRSSSGRNFNSNLLGLEFRLSNFDLSIGGVVSTSSINCKSISFLG